jgi:aminopeptidase-like protein
VIGDAPAAPIVDSGTRIHELMRELFPICRSLTGDGVRETLRIIGELIPLEIVETPTGTQVFDWSLPKEWNIREAWIQGPDGRRVVDFADSNLHVVGYSTPIRAPLPLAELRPHLFTHATDRSLVPFRTSYYGETWGFCLSGETLDSLEEGEYEVYIDSTLDDGHVTYGEARLPGEQTDEILLSTYCCHPSLANDNLSGVALLAILGSVLATRQRRYSYRLLFSPGTVGPLTWLWRNEAGLERVRHAIVVSSAGDPGAITYKRSPDGDAVVDRAAAHVLRASGRPHTVNDWVPWGGDERQFGAPGFALPVGSFSRTPADNFPEYHSSADNLEFVQPGPLGDSLEALLEILAVVEGNERYVNLSPKGEPQLGKRGLYRRVGGGSSEELALLWVLNQSDGSRDLLAIADRAGIPFPEIRNAADRLLEHDLLAPAR